MRPEIASARELWIERRRRFFNKALAQLVFIDETSTNTKLTKRTGWAPKGQRYRTHAPFGQWRTQTFIAGLRCHGLTAPWIVNAPMNRRIFETWVQTQLAPTLSRGDVVILDNVGFHKSDRADQLVKAKGAWLLFLPAYSPDLNPIEMAFSNSKLCCANEQPEASMPLLRPSAISSVSSRSPNVETSSKLPAMRLNKCDTL
ncbi:IS630 family transposase [Rhizobium ruizarguesonis]|uniref:IS630 family transposase n=1 Tax=Rhizobium ruizarguesonis TaxID=2081791 RepID=UPI001FE23C94|nr:IS630 family transposase [Rhizobium ruizarguesonis]